MQKNVVGRLKNLENEIKNVLSICEIQNNEQEAYKEIQARAKHPVRSSSNAVCGKHGSFHNGEEQASYQTEISIEKPLRNNKITAGILRKKSSYEKPNSAPPGGPAPITETASHMKRKRSVQRAPKKGDGIAAEDSIEWFDCSPQTSEVPEQMLRPAEEIMINVSHYGNDDYYPKQPMNWCEACRRWIHDCVCREHRWDSQWENDDRTEDINKNSFIHLVKPDLKENPVINELARKIERKEMEVKSDMKGDHRKPIKCRHRAGQDNEIKNPPEGITELGEYHKSEVFEPGKGQNETPNARPMTAPAKTRSCNRYGLVRRRTHGEEGDEGRSPVENTPDEWQPMERDRYRDDENIRTVEDIIEDPNYVKWIEDAIIEQQESASDAESSAKLSEDLKILKQKKNLSDATTRKIAEIIERNHQKIEEMRRSRFLALSTVKSMKEKYDALAEMKNKMEEKLDILIKSNRLRSRQKMKWTANSEIISNGGTGYEWTLTENLT